MVESLPLVVLGGTFDHLHAGHKRLLEEALLHAPKVGLGLTSDRLAGASKAKGEGIASFEDRKRDLEIVLRRSYPATRWYVKELDDPNGVILEPETPGLAVSEETLPVALKANSWRRDHGLKPLTLVVVGRLYAQDLLPIASRRIRRGDIDREGRRLTPIRVRVEGSPGPEVSALLLSAFKRLLPGFSVKLLEESKSGETTPDYSVEWKFAQGTPSLGITDLLGGKLESRVSIGPARAHPALDGAGVLPAVASQLVAGAFTSRMLSRNDFLPRSIVIEGKTERWPATAEWTRKVYSSSGVFPFQ